MGTPTTRQEHIDYILRELGHPVIEINVDPEQIEDRVDEALQKFQNWHFDGVFRTYLKHTITQNDIDNEYIPVDDSIMTVNRIFPFNSTLQAHNIFNISFIQNTLGDIHRGSVDLTTYDMTKQYINLIDEILIGEASLRFNKHMNQIFLDVDWSKRFVVGDNIIFEVFQIVDPQEFPNVWNDEFLKKYTSALIKKQWGTNLKKYNGVELVGGVTLNGKEIYDEAVEELNQLDEDIDSKYTIPPMFFTG